MPLGAELACIDSDGDGAGISEPPVAVGVYSLGGIAGPSG
jgi:hypothetical protein